MSNKLLIPVFAVLLGSASLHAAENFLVASTRSNSLEQFNTSGTWVRTFATTGPYNPNAVAQSPLTGEIFVTTVVPSGATGTVLRYRQMATLMSIGTLSLFLLGRRACFSTRLETCGWRLPMEPMRACRSIFTSTWLRTWGSRIRFLNQARSWPRCIVVIRWRLTRWEISA